MHGKFYNLLLILAFVTVTQFASAQNYVGEKMEIGSSSCQKDLSILSVADLKSLSKEEKIAFLRSREDESKKIALELHQLLTDEFSQKLFNREQRLGLSPAEPISKILTIEEIVRRLVILNSVGE